jgi:hypothetical protein
MNVSKSGISKDLYFTQSALILRRVNCGIRHKFQLLIYEIKSVVRRISYFAAQRMNLFRSVFDT